MLKNSILVIILVMLFTANIEAEELNYPPAFTDDLAASLIKSISYDNANNYLYVNGYELLPVLHEDKYNYSLTINNIQFHFIYSNIEKTITIHYEKPIETKIPTEINVYSINNKTYLSVSDVSGTRDYLGIENNNRIIFNSILININNTQSILNAYLDKDLNKLIFNNEKYNFTVNLKEEKTVDVIYSGWVENNKIYAVNDAMDLKSSLNGELSEERINDYLSKISINLSNNTYALTKSVQLKKIMDKWVNISGNYKKENTITSCVNKESMCEVFEKTAYLINDYNYKGVEEDKAKLVEGTHNTPKDKRIYSSEDLISEKQLFEENLEEHKQERDVIKEYNTWTEYKEEECKDSDNKKCRYKSFYTKQTYPYVKSEPQYSKWQKANYKLDAPVEETDTQYTKGPYWNCTKYEQIETEYRVTECLARDETAHKMIAICEDDPFYQKVCMSSKLVYPKKEYNLEPVEEANRDFCSKCLVKKTQIVNKDEDGSEYANLVINGIINKIYLPKGDCTDVKSETYTKIENGLCEIMEQKYDLYKREYLGEKDFYEEEPIIEENLEECTQTTNKEEGMVECFEKTKTSYSIPDIKYSEWSDVDDFTFKENTERRYRYRDFKTYGIKLIDKLISKNEYNKNTAQDYIKNIAEEKTKLAFTNTTNQYALLNEYTKTDAYNSNKQNNIYLLENEKLFAPVIHVLKSEVNQLDTVKFPQYVGSKQIGESSLYTTEHTEQILYMPANVETDKKIVFFNKNDTSKIDSAQNWNDKEELLKTIKESDIDNPKYEITIKKEQLEELNKWVNKKENRDKKNCELIREFSGIVSKPTNFNELLLRTSGCEF